MIKLKANWLNDNVNDQKIKKIYQKKVNNIYEAAANKTAKGSELTGWIDLVKNYDMKQLAAMKAKATSWKKANIKNIVVIGIGGSYVGVKAAIDMTKPYFKKHDFNFFYVHNIHNNYIVSILNELAGKSFAILVVSKSGTTFEPMIAFELFRSLLEKTVPQTNLKELIVAVTDKSKGLLLDFAKANGYTSFYINDDIGGRFSALTPIGMFFMIVCGLDPNKILNGAKDAAQLCMNLDLDTNSAARYACYRHYFYKKCKCKIENFVFYDPGLYAVGEMCKQMFGESEGKAGLSLYPSASLFTTDLHSMGQWFSQGPRYFFETTFYVEKPMLDIKLDFNTSNENLSYLNKKTLGYVNDTICNAVMTSHCQNGKTNNLLVSIEKQDEYHFGYLFTWLSFAAMVSGYLLKINPFDQPGVEDYKKEMLKQLKK